METKTKIHLSPLEKDLLTNKEWILTKRSVIEKVCQLFGLLNGHYQQMVLEEGGLPRVAKTGHQNSGRMSKGENYQGLPYVMLDYPGTFSRENIFAIRTFFWWGNFFSITLHLSGESFDLHQISPQAMAFLKEKSFYVCVNTDPWKHEFTRDNYRAADDVFQGYPLENRDKNFLKISRKLRVEDWEDAEGFLTGAFREILQFIKISFPTGETGL